MNSAGMVGQGYGRGADPAGASCRASFRKDTLVARLLASTIKPASWYTSSMKVTIDLDPELYRAIKIEAAKSDRSVRDIVDEALAHWLDALEEAEDQASAAEALDEYRREGGTAAEVFLESLAAETKATYGVDEP